MSRSIKRAERSQYLVIILKNVSHLFAFSADDGIWLRAKGKDKSCQISTFQSNRETKQANRYYISMSSSSKKLMQCTLLYFKKAELRITTNRVISETNKQKKCTLVNERYNDRKEHLGASLWFLVNTRKQFKYNTIAQNPLKICQMQNYCDIICKTRFGTCVYCRLIHLKEKE